MATSGTIYTPYDSENPYYRFYLKWQLASQSTADNTSKINWQIGVNIRNSGYLGSNATILDSAYVGGGGSVASGTFSNISGDGDHQLRSGSKTVTHKSDGTYTLSVSVAGHFIGDSPNALTASGSYPLTTIPRNSQVTTNDSGHYDLGTSLTIYTNRKSTSFTHTITIRAKNSSGAIIHTQNSVGASFVWTPSSAEITAMEQQIPTANSLVLYIDQYNNQVDAHSNVSVTTYLTNAAPVFTNITYKDTDATTVGITGNNQVLVKGKSVLEVDVSTTNKMVAQKYATENHYSFLYDGVSQLENYSSSATVSATFSPIQTIGDRTIIVDAFDSRNNSTRVSVPVTVYDYSPPTIQTTLTRLNNFESDTTLHIEGTYSLLTINGTNKNTLASGTLQYQYAEDGGTMGSWTTVSFTDNGDGTYSVTDFIVSLDNTKKFNFNFKISDQFGGVTSANSVDVGEPIIFIGQNNGQAALGIGKMPENGTLDVNGDIYSNGGRVITGVAWSTNNTSQLSVSMAGGYAHKQIGVSISSDLVAGATYQIAMHCAYVKTASSATEMDLGLTIDGTEQGDRGGSIGTGGVNSQRSALIYYTAPDSATHTFSLWGSCSGAATTMTFYSPNIYVHRVA